MPESKIIHRFFCIMLTLRRYTHESPGSQYFPKLELDSRSSPLPPRPCWYKHKREKSNAPVCDPSKRLLVCTTSNIKIPGQGDTHRVKMKSKASGQTTDAVVAEWQANCLWDTWTCHSLSNIEVCANASSNMSKHQPAGKRLKKSTLAASTLACYVFICTNLEQTRNTRPISQFTMAGTLQVAKLWHAGFSYVQTSSKPCSNLKSMGPDHASRCDRIFKGKFNWFLFLRAAAVDSSAA